MKSNSDFYCLNKVVLVLVRVWIFNLFWILDFFMNLKKFVGFFNRKKIWFLYK